MSIDKYFDAYVECRGIVPSAEVVPDHRCHIFDGPLVEGGPAAESGERGESHSSLERARELVLNQLTG